jgi:hypothetical protein
VSHRNAPGAIRAIALLVSPVRPSVACICGAFCSAIEHSPGLDSFWMFPAINGPGSLWASPDYDFVFEPMRVQILD